MYRIPKGTPIEVVRPLTAGADIFDWDDSISAKTKHEWICPKESIAIDPIGSIAPSNGNLIGFRMNSKDHDFNFGKWEGSIILMDYDRVEYLD